LSVSSKRDRRGMSVALWLVAVTERRATSIESRPASRTWRTEAEGVELWENSSSMADAKVPRGSQ
jgi:hypothetical protein